MKSLAICPVCRAPRNEKLTDNISPYRHLQLLLITLAICGLGYLIGGLPLALKLVIVYLPFWAVADYFHGIQMRKATQCPTCNFDPVLYRRDWKAARDQVEARLQKVVDDLRAQHLALIEKARAARGLNLGEIPSGQKQNPTLNPGLGPKPNDATL